MKPMLLLSLGCLLSLSCNIPGSTTGTLPVTETAEDSSKTVAGQEREQISSAYTTAIAEYIKAAYAGKPLPDTLFIGRHPELPDIELPATIQNTNIQLLTDAGARKKLAYRTSLVYLNVMGHTCAEHPEFLIVCFRELRPKHNCFVYLKPGAGHSWQLDSLSFEYPY